MKKKLKLLMMMIIFLIVNVLAVAKNESAYNIGIEANVYMFHDIVCIGNFDTDPPTVLYTFPVDGATDVVTNITIQISFSEEMDVSTVIVTGLPILGDIWSGTSMYLGVSLEFSTTYTVTVNGDDLAGNSMTEYSFSFTTEQESTPPTVTSTTPIDGTTDVVIDETVAVTFSEEMDISTVFVTGLPNPTYSWIGNTVTIGHDQFVYDSTYIVHVNGEDLAGNQLSETSFLFVTEEEPDLNPPSIVFTTPVDGATDVALDVIVSITFDEKMDEDSVVVTGLSNVTYSWIGNTVTVGHDQFVYDSTYIVHVNGEDTVGNVMSEYVFSFTTRADTDPPSIVFTTPVDGATDVALDAIVSITFDEKMDEDSVVVTGLPNIGYGWDGNTVTISHDQFDYDSTYQVVVNGEDIFGNVMSEYIFSFTVKFDNDPPTVVFTTPADGAIDVPIDAVISVIFNELMDTSSVNIGGLQGTSNTWQGNTVTVSYSGYLICDVTYTLSINGQDTAGNTMYTNFSFTTEEGPDHEKPFIVSTTPANGTTDVVLDAVVGMTFSEMMNQSTITVTGLPDTGYEWVDSILTVNHENLNYSTTYNVVVNGKDLVGNSLTETSFMFVTVGCNPYLVAVDTVGCDSVVIEGVAYTTNQDVEVTYITANGCDSVVTYHVVINYAPDMPSAIQDDNNDNIVGGGETITYQVDISNDPYAIVVWNITGDNQIEIDNNTLTVTWINPGVVSVAYLNDCGSSDSLTVVVNEIVGVENIVSAQYVSIYPNPATDYIQILSERNIQSIMLYNAFGSIVLINKNVSSFKCRIPVDLYQPGVYLIKIIFDKEEYIIRTMIK